MQADPPDRMPPVWAFVTCLVGVGLLLLAGFVAWVAWRMIR